MQKRRPEPKLRRLRRPQTAWPRRHRTGILGNEFLCELQHQLLIRNEPDAHYRAARLFMIDERSDPFRGNVRKFQAHVDAVLKMYGAPVPPDIRSPEDLRDFYDRFVAA